MRIAFIRSVDLQQAQPTLNNIQNYALQNDIQMKLFYTEGNRKFQLFPGEFEKVREDIGVEELAQKIINWGAEAVISISLPDNNAHRDSYLKEFIETNFEIPVIMHPIRATTLLSNKWETNQWLKRNGYIVPNSILVYGDLISKRTVNYVSYIDFVLSQVNKFKEPYFLKPLWDSMSTGVRKFKDIGELKNFIYETKLDYDFVIEEQVNGGLYGMELIGNNGHYFCQPLVKKCTNITDSLIPFDHVRYGPYPLNNQEIVQLEKMFIEIGKKLEICGSIEFEFIGNDSGFHIIEINPRVSGMTNLSSTISGINTYECLLQLAKGLSIKPHNSEKFTLELPLENMSIDKFNKLTLYKEIFSINHVVYHNDTEQYKMLLQIVNLEEALLFLSEVNKKYNIIPFYVFSEIKQELNEREILI